MSWYLRSLGDRDIHHGTLAHPDGTITAACGIRFRPPEFLRGTTALRGEPPDPDQICPACDTRRKDDARRVEAAPTRKK